MIAPQDAAVLQEQIRRTGRSLLQYTAESMPWTGKEKDREILARILGMKQAEQQAAEALARFLINNRMNPPYLGSYPMHFTTMNFLAIPRLVQLLADHQQKDVTDTEAAVGQVQAPECKQLLEQLLEIKKQNWESLKELNNPQ